MKYLGRLVVLAQAALMAGSVTAGTVTLNDLSCGTTVGNVNIDGAGNITIVTTDKTSCAPGASSGSGPYTLTVARGGTGAGTVSSTVNGSPSTIDCGATCNASYDSGTVVTLSAAASGSDNTFAGWSGAGCAGAGTCVVTMSAAKTVTATFNPASTGGGDTTMPSGVTYGGDLGTLKFAQVEQSIKAGQILAFKTTTGASGAGYVSTSKLSSSVGGRLVVLSTSPGSFTAGTGCAAVSADTSSNNWQIGGTSAYACVLPANSTVWINIKPTSSCTVGSTCKFLLVGK